MLLRNFGAIGWMIAEILRMSYFQHGGLPPSWIFKICKFSRSGWFRATICMFLQNLVAIGRTVAELLQNIDFQYGGRPPSWIRCTHARDHPRSALYGVYYYAKLGWNRLSLIISKFNGFCTFAGNCLFTPLLGRFLGVWPTKWGGTLTRPPKSTSLRGTTPFDVWSVKIGTSVRAGR